MQSKTAPESGMSPDRVEAPRGGQDILKVFFEEPFSLEGGLRLPAVSAGERRVEAVAYRLYLAGTSLSPSGHHRIGLSALSDRAQYVEPLVRVFGEEDWYAYENDHAQLLSGPRLREALARPSGALTVGAVDPAIITSLVGKHAREVLFEIAEVLKTCRVLLSPEPAHDGSDWSIFAASPVRERFAEALSSQARRSARRFVLPYQKARSEERFYFEQWQLASLPPFVTEI